MVLKLEGFNNSTSEFVLFCVADDEYINFWSTKYKQSMYDKYLYKEKTVRYIFDKVNRIYHNDLLLYEDFKTFLECLNT